ncbi:uncharacterized protein LOC131219188 [Magnolia sinica]|uniref:uncharacterized protein LOC131219188 n=1 Tax=Magnolia sinica TaxID=86752 RepID=UPI00265894E6|nr:uncharacterized protein LOC131219188 [Magnolia sinica]
MSIVFVGRVPRLYDRWEDAHAQVDRYPRCRHQSYKSYDEARRAWENFHNDRDQQIFRRFKPEARRDHELAIIEEDIVGLQVSDAAMPDLNRDYNSFVDGSAIWKVVIGVLLIYVVVVWIVANIS